MPLHNELIKYIGREYTNNCIADIKAEFRPYKIYICDIDIFYQENYMYNTIRCVIENNIIVRLKFN
jgi:hypothetical protein